MRSHLTVLEEEAIYFLRETLGLFRKPALLYSIGKDSSVLLHVAAKAFGTTALPLPVLHVDTTWKFKEMIAFRDATAARMGLDLIVHRNEDGVKAGISPFGNSASYTDVMKTQALRQALDAGGFDAAIGGARRDEERSRAKERVFSHRLPGHRWDPQRQRPELWRTVNPSLGPGETMRVFPLSNWTEGDIWAYIAQETIPVVPLYFAKPRPVVRRGDMLMVRDDERMRLGEGEQVEMRSVRFRTLGCYPLTAAIESTATDVASIIEELRHSSLSERQGRLIDADQSASMERKKRQGYF